MLLLGRPLHNISTGVDIFFSIILLYFSCLLLAFIPYHGKYPFKKYTKTYPIASKSSLRDYSIPKWAFIDAYLAVPVRFLFSLYGMC